MKFLLLFLISFNLYAQHVYEIVPNNSKLTGYQLVKPTKADLDIRLLSLVKKVKWLKGTWNDVAQDAIVSEEIIGMDGEEPTVRYYHPSNFTVAYEDITADMQTKEANKVAENTEKTSVRALIKSLSTRLDKKSSETVAQYRTRRALVIERILLKMAKDLYGKEK